MKKRLFFTILSLSVMLFSSCQHDVFLPNPNIPAEKVDTDKTDSLWHAPQNFISTQGLKEIVILTWDPVKDAVRYNIYRADNEFEDFVQVAETKGLETKYEIKADPGFDMYYRVTAVDITGKESEMSNIERATTLSKPYINRIEGAADKNDSDVYVSWYMNNADAYLDSVFYNVVCYDEKNKEIQSQQSLGNNTTVLFTGLSPNTKYFFEVEAYNLQGESEFSARLDADTARRLKPDPATNLVVEQGLSKDSIKISFVLPNFVDVMEDKDSFVSTPIYFKIYRRVYKEGENTEPFELIKGDFGVNKDSEGVIDYKKVKFGDTAEDYTPGNAVTYIDKDAELKRGEKYEYKVQSFAYTKLDISSDESIAQTEQPGWLLPEASFEVKEFKYSETAEKQKKAEVSFKMTITDNGIPYNYKIIETKRGLAEGSESTSYDLLLTNGETMTNNLDVLVKPREFVHISNEDLSDEGYYSYQAVILSEDGTVVLDTINTVGEILVTGKPLPVVGDITIKYGYEDKVILTWPYDKKNGYVYNLKCWDEGSVTEKSIPVNPPTEGTEIVITDKVDANNEDSIKPGVKRYYQLVVKSGDLLVPSDLMEVTIPKKPELTSIFAYDKISVEVNNPQSKEKSSYERVVEFEDPKFKQDYKLIEILEDEKIIDLNDKLSHVFNFKIVKNNQPGGSVEDSINAEIAGAKIKVTVTENHPLEVKVFEDKNKTEESQPQDNVQTVTADTTTNPEIKTVGLSNTITTAYVGPALLHLTASEKINADNITVTWDKVLGADSYVVFRDRYHLGRSGKQDNLELQNSMSDKYIVTLNEDGTVTVKCDDAELEASELSKYVSAVYSVDTGKFTLTDTYRAKTDTDTGNQWRTGQAEITWGAPNKYTVMPVLSVADADSCSKEENKGRDSKDIVSIGNTKIKEVSSILGGTKGFGWNVTATKGTYSSSTSGEKVNDAIEVKWTQPYFGYTGQYTVFKKEVGNPTAEWIHKLTDPGETSYIDKEIEQGKVYDYLIMGSGYTEPDLNYQKSQKLGENGSELTESLGFILPKPKIEKISRSDRGVNNEDLGINYEQVQFYTDPLINDMISGYVIQVRNNNIDSNWHDIKTVPITPDNKNMELFTEIVENSKTKEAPDGLLKVLRDYKHYYTIRAYTEVGSEKVYSKPDETPFINNMDTDYVKWGCRQISNEEFTRAANLLITYGIHYLWVEKPENPVNTISKTTKGGTFWKTDTFNFNGYQRSIKTKDGIYTPFLNIKGKLNADYYGAYNPYQLNSGKINFVCEDVLITELYKGVIEYSNNGKMKVTYGNETKEYQYYEPNGTYCPLALGKAKGTSGFGDLPAAGDYKGYKHETEEWQ